MARALRSAQHAADCADLISGAARIRGRMLVHRVKQATRSGWMVRDQRWSDALAVVSLIAPLLLLLVAALAEFHLPQAVASSVTGHPQWRLTATLGLGDLPTAAGPPAVAALALLRLAGPGRGLSLLTRGGAVLIGAVLVSVAAVCLRAPVSIPSSLPLLYLPPLLLACVTVAGTWLARRRHHHPFVSKYSPASFQAGSQHPVTR